jgi:hypothetical protein
MRQTKIDLYLIPFIFTYSFVQLAEAFMWYDTSCGKINIIGTYMAYTNLYLLHLIAIGIGIYLVEKRKYGIFIGILTALYFFITMPKIKCSKFKNNTMYWGFNSKFYMYIYLLAVLLLMFSKMPSRYKIFLLFWYSISWLYFFYKQFKSFKKLLTPNDANIVASLWCHISSFTVPGLYLIQNIIKP